MVSDQVEAPDAGRGSSATGAPGWQVALILLGILVTPVVLSAPTLGNGLALSWAASAIVVGSLILAVLAALTLSIGQHARQPTYDIVRFPFGRRGAKAINVLLAVSLFGWTSVTANGFGNAAQGLLDEVFGVSVALPVLVVIGCVIFVASTAFGFDVIGKVAQIAVPVIALILAYLVYQTLTSGRDLITPTDPIAWGVGVSSVVGTGIVLVVTAADFGSFTRSRRQALVAAVIAFVFAYPALYLAGALPAAFTGDGALIGAMAVIASALPAILLLLFASITANAGNMFQGTLALSTLLPKVRKNWKITVGLGVAAAILGSFDASAWLPSFLLFLGIAAPPVAGIYIVDFFRHRLGGYDAALLTRQRAIHWEVFAVWLVGSVVGYLTAYEVFSLTQIPSIDSLLVSAILYGLLGGVTVRRNKAVSNRNARQDTAAEGQNRFTDEG